MNMLGNLNSNLRSAEDLAKQIAKVYEKGVSDEISDLVKKGLLVIKFQGAAFYYSPTEDGIQMAERVTIELKDQEYITKLEDENKELKVKLNSIQQTLKWNV